MAESRNLFVNGRMDKFTLSLSLSPSDRRAGPQEACALDVLEGELDRQLDLARNPLERCGRTRRGDGPVRGTSSDIGYECGAVRCRGRGNG